LEVLEDRLQPSVNWTGGGDGTSWTDPNNWSSLALPGSGDDVFIGGSFTVRHQQGTETLHSLHSSGNVAFTGTLKLLADSDLAGSFSLNGTLDQAAGRLDLATTNDGLLGRLTAEAGATVQFDQGFYTLDNRTFGLFGAGLFRFAGAVININGVAPAPQNLELASGLVTGGNLNVNGILTWTGGVMAGSGSTSVLPAGSLILDGAASKTLSQRTLGNQGTDIFNGSGSLSINDGAVWTNFRGGTMDVRDGGSIGTVNSGRFDNVGTFLKSTSSGAAQLNAGLFFNNTGTVRVAAGTLQILIDGQYGTGLFTVDAGAALEFAGPVNHSMSAGSTVNGGGAVIFSAGNASIDASYNVGRTDVNNASVTFFRSASTGTLNFSSGSLGGNSTITVTNLLVWTGGSMSGAGVTVVAATASAQLTGSSTKALVGRTFNNFGAALWSGTGSVDFGAGAVWNNLATATLDIQGDASMRQASSPAGTFNNAGDVRKSAGIGTTVWDGVNMNNDGTFEVLSGTVALGAGTSGGSFTVAAGATLSIGANSSNATTAFGTDSSITGAGTVNFVGSSSTLVGGSFGVSKLNIRGGSANVRLEQDATFTDGTVSGMLNGAGNVTFTNSLTWTGGSILGTGGITIASGAVALLDGNANRTLSRVLDNNGDVLWNGGNLLTLNGTWNNNTSGTLILQLRQGFEELAGTGSFHNTGLARFSTGVFCRVLFTNDGVVDLHSAGLTLLQGATHSGRFTVDTNSTISFDSGPSPAQVLTAASSISGLGTAEFGFGQATVNCNVNVGRILIGGASVDFTTDATATNLELEGGTLINEASMTIGIAFFGGPATFTDLGTVVVSSLQLIRDGIINGTGDLTLTGTCLWGDGSLSGTGTMTVAQNARLILNNGANMSGATLNNAGTVTAAASVNFGFFQGATLNNLATGTLDLQQNVAFINAFLDHPSTINNSGLLRIAASMTVGASGPVLFNNDGAVQVQRGELALRQGSGAATGSFVVSAGAFLTFGLRGTSAYDYTFTDTSSITGAGEVDFFVGSVTVNGDCNLGVAGIESTVVFEHDASFRIVGLSSGSLGGSANVTVTQRLSWGGGAMSGTGTTTIAAGATVDLRPLPFFLPTRLDGRTLDNAGAATWAPIATGSFTISGGATWINRATALFDVQSDGAILDQNTGGTFINAGTLRKSAGTGVFALPAAVEFDNTGTVRVPNGTLLIKGPGTNAGHITVDAPAALDLRGNYTLADNSVIDGAGIVSFSAGTIRLGGSVSAGGGIVIGPNAVVFGTGVLTGSVVNAGTLSLGDDSATGIITIRGDYMQTQSGVLRIAMGGLTAGDEFDQLNVSGRVTLAGTLDVILVNGFTPQVGDAFTILTFGSRTGDFQTYLGLQMAGQHFNPQFDATDLVLVVVGG
jgi:hypothetical protein